MEDRILTQSDEILRKWDCRIGKSAQYIQVGDATLDLETGISTPNNTLVPDVVVRESEITEEDAVAFSAAGLTNVETRFNMRSAYVNPCIINDQIQITDTGAAYLILKATLDTLGVDWTLLTRRMRT